MGTRKSAEPFPAGNLGGFRLRKPKKSDASSLLAVTKDIQVMQFYGMTAYETVSKALDEIAWFNGIFRRQEGIRWVISPSDSDAYIGDIGLHNHSRVHHRAEIGFKLAKAYWRRGIMSEAVAFVVEYGLRTMRLNRVEALVDPRNAACLGLLEKQGFFREGILREYELEEKGYVDLVMLSLLKKDRRQTGDMA